MLPSRLVRLRAVEPIDADFMYEIENDPECWRYGETIAPLSRRIIREYAMNYDADPISARQLRLIIVSVATDRPVGMVDLYEIDPIHRTAFVGIYILPSLRRKGYGSEALQILEKYASQTLRLRILGVRIESDNERSLKLFEGAGFVKRGNLPQWYSHPDGSFSDMMILSRSL